MTIAIVLATPVPAMALVAAVTAAPATVAAVQTTTAAAQATTAAALATTAILATTATPAATRTASRPVSTWGACCRLSRIQRRTTPPHFTGAYTASIE